MPEEIVAMANKREDHVDRLRAQWAKELPDLDTAPMSVLGRIYRLSRLFSRSIEGTFAGFGLDRGEFDVLSSLRRSGPPYRLTPTDLYGALMVASGSLTHRLGRLERAELVARRPSPDDGRSMAVELTKKGKRIVEDAFRADMANEARFMALLSKDDRKRLEALLRKFALQVEALDGRQPAKDGRGRT
jgi:DNA-binding MarR family transcriptional regulator